jgi:group I intron endonuclease
MYVGQTNNIEKRVSGHKSAAKTRPTQPISLAIAKHGWEAFKFTILEEVESLNDANEAEEFWIGYLCSTHRGVGYNVKMGGNNVKFTSAHKANLKRNHRGRTGQPHSEETKALMSSKMMGNKNGLGGVRTPEQKARIGEAISKAKAPSDAIKQTIIKLSKDGFSIREVSRRTGVSRPLINKLILKGQ